MHLLRYVVFIVFFTGCGSTDQISDDQISDTQSADSKFESISLKAENTIEVTPTATIKEDIKVELKASITDVRAEAKVAIKTEPSKEVQTEIKIDSKQEIKALKDAIKEISKDAKDIVIPSVEPTALIEITPISIVQSIVIPVELPTIVPVETSTVIPTVIPLPTPILSSVHIVACIDGSDWFGVENNQLSIQHRNYFRIGTHYACDSDLKNTIYVDGIAYDSLAAAIPVNFNTITSFNVNQGRGQFTLDQNRVLVDDDGIGSSARYDFIITGYLDNTKPIVQIPQQIVNHRSVEFRGCVDGSDFLSIENGFLVITHRNYTELGKHINCPQDYKGVVYLNGEKFSLGGAIPINLSYITSIEPVIVRGKASISNNKVLLDDDGLGSSDIYVVKLIE